MPFSQGVIDFEQYQAFGGNCNSGDHPGDYFSDELLGQSTLNHSAESWPRFPSLPTPPSSPEKRVRTNHYSHCHSPALEMASTDQFNAHRSRSSPSNNLQVVPDSIPEGKVDDILPWLTELENSGVVHSTEGYFKECISSGHPLGSAQMQANLCSPSREHYLTQSQGHLEDLNADHVSKFCGPRGMTNDQTSMAARFNETPEKPCYRFCEPGLAFTATSGFHQEQQPITTLSMTSQGMPNAAAVPDCILSPVSPTKSLKRPYYQISPMQQQQQQQPRPIMPTARVARELFPIEFLNNNLPPAESSTDVFLQGMTNDSSHDDLDGSGEGELSRATHNVLERQRRNDLKMRFHILRDNLPDLISNEKAPKIQILKKAHEHVQELQAHEQRLLADKELERQRKLILLQRLHILRQGFFEF